MKSNMTKERLEDIIENVLNWGTEHAEEFRECLINAMGLTKEEIKELHLEDYTNISADDDKDKEILNNIAIFLIVKTALSNDVGPCTFMDIKEIEEIYSIKLSADNYYNLCDTIRRLFGSTLFDLNDDYDKDAYEESKDIALTLQQEFHLKGKPREHIVKMLKKKC